MKLRDILETYSHEDDLQSALSDRMDELPNAGFIDGAIYIHDETTIGDVPVYWEWTEKEGYVVHHDTDGKNLSPNIQRIIDQKLKEMDPVKSGKYDEQIEMIDDMKEKYNKFRQKQDDDEGRGDYEYQRRKDDALTGDR